VTREEVESLMRGIAPVLRQYVRQEIEAAAARPAPAMPDDAPAAGDDDAEELRRILVDRAKMPLARRVRLLEQMVLLDLPPIILEGVDARLDARKVLQDCGVWAADKAYGAGDLVSDRGAAWIAQRAAPAGERPGTSDAWRLPAKTEVAEVAKLVRAELAKQRAQK
jgi:hypothetical protein